MAKADRERASFIAAMGISHELDDLIRTVKFENSHMLTRPELYRFGIDTRAIAETGWTLETAARPYVRKIALAKKSDGASFRTMEWRLFCENKDRARLMFIREFDKAAAGVEFGGRDGGFREAGGLRHVSRRELETTRHGAGRLPPMR